MTCAVRSLGLVDVAVDYEWEWVYCERMQNPAWLTIIAALGGALIALVASLSTTLLTSRHATKRLGIELSHARQTEREKLLFAARMDLYAKVPQLCDEVYDYFHWVFEELTRNAPVESLYPNQKSMKIINDAEVLRQQATIVSTKAVLDGVNEFLVSILAANGVLQRMRDSGQVQPASDFPLPELSISASKLRLVIREEFGVAASEGRLR